ncbi:cbb3-type cytochrome oxidase assembly protein CcoS [Chitiniphilus purpureus]|uniref:Cbb3-type cytochrome oxidase assembly protein CcoS n=1 Tax=Chitiniphilus purpureus TaxID=2981137 RepID=A0ABY6DIC2_9NEIS|nr:cbb3-type cytochrome oxidase assembly protein CcoS [Chitiniphilus sp. CD1]UXY13983.1 cbb3-type cytochrome oxidase assembly protein CcoS [Chitiniphilus sp. CD1]
MESLYLLIPLSVLLAFCIGGLFWWAVKSGQFDDLDGPAHRVLHDEDINSEVNENTAEDEKNT